MPQNLPLFPRSAGTRSLATPRRSTPWLLARETPNDVNEAEHQPMPYRYHVVRITATILALVTAAG